MVPNGSYWKCTDESLDEHGLFCKVIDADNNPDFNGDNDIEIKYENGTVAYMKLRRFVDRHTRVYRNYPNNPRR